jgi:hypothetical protein
MVDDTENVPPAGKLGGIIPHFHYDVIGRILPGVFFVIGLAVLFLPQDVVTTLKCVFAPPKSEQSGAYLIFLLTLILLLVVPAAYVVGAFLGSLSYFPFEKWSRCRKVFLLPHLTGTTVLKSLRPQPSETQPSEKKTETEHGLPKAFRDRFGVDIDENNSEILVEQSRMCIYYVWFRSVSLGQMGARWDAEALASRNILFGAAVLLFLRIGQMIKNWDGRYSFALIMTAIAVSALVMYEYVRRRQITGRFSLFWALAKED